MASTKAKITMVASSDGRVIAAQFESSERPSKDQPASRLVLPPGCRSVTVSIPGEIARLSMGALDRFLSEVRVHPDGEVHMPKIKVIQGRASSGRHSHLS